MSSIIHYRFRHYSISTIGMNERIRHLPPFPLYGDDGNFISFVAPLTSLKKLTGQFHEIKFVDENIENQIISSTFYKPDQNMVVDSYPIYKRKLVAKKEGSTTEPPNKKTANTQNPPQSSSTTFNFANQPQISSSYFQSPSENLNENQSTSSVPMKAPTINFVAMKLPKISYLEDIRKIVDDGRPSEMEEWNPLPKDNNIKSKNNVKSKIHTLIDEPQAYKDNDKIDGIPVKLIKPVLARLKHSFWGSNILLFNMGTYVFDESQSSYPLRYILYKICAMLNTAFDTTVFIHEKNWIDPVMLPTLANSFRSVSNYTDVLKSLESFECLCDENPRICDILVKKHLGKINLINGVNDYPNHYMYKIIPNEDNKSYNVEQLYSKDYYPSQPPYVYNTANPALNFTGFVMSEFTKIPPKE